MDFIPIDSHNLCGLERCLKRKLQKKDSKGYKNCFHAITKFKLVKVNKHHQVPTWLLFLLFSN
jgi:hypothetical protein